MDQKSKSILKETGISVIGVAICEALMGSQPVRLTPKLSERASLIAGSLKPFVSKMKGIDEESISELAERGSAIWKSKTLSGRGSKSLTEALMESGYYTLSDSVLPLSALDEAPLAAEADKDKKALNSKKEDAKYLDSEETNAIPTDEAAPEDPDADQMAADGMGTTPEAAQPDESQADPNAVDPNDPNAEDPNALTDDGLPAEEDMMFDPSVDSTVALNDNYRNEHLYDCLIKLQKLADSTGEIFQKLSADRVTSAQQRLCNEQEKRLNSLKAEMSRYVTDIFMDKVYTENLYAYHYMQADLVDICKKIREILSV